MSIESEIDQVKQRLADSQNQTYPYLMHVFGLDLVVHEGVFPPSHFFSWRWSVENFPSVRGQRVLEIGCGMGLPSIYLAKNGAAVVVAVDIDPRAVTNTQENAERNRIDNIVVLQSDMFSAVEPSQKFDTIYWNFPDFCVPEGYEYANDLERGVFDPGYAMLRSFLKQASAHLAEDGRVLLEFAEGDRVTTLSELANANGYAIELIARGSLPEGGRVYQFYELKTAIGSVSTGTSQPAQNRGG
ncbi:MULTISPECIES: class I SAM-dependent methyltransferase [unclassified Mesorhizobium]|uniref:Rossmann-like fold-containing protein n=1 Tax=unclassified Mesorhizobium TaxID=325217 RepID=UPI00122B4245|nr:MULTISPECIES: class I SAM-dependent methyltransferase [unclassified Mesorhizobium]TIU78641.1 MAG: class I SAM-dependent methyltransferase [Mesorhizobium sp.]